MKDTNDLLNHLLDRHQMEYDLKNPVRHESKVKAIAPKYIIVAKGIFPDTIKGRKDAGFCYTFKTAIYRMPEDENNKHSKAIGSGKIVKKDVIVCVPSGRWGASLQAHMAQSIVIKSVCIVRSELDGEIENVLQETEFTNCRIMTYDQQDDKIIFSFTYDTKTDDFTDYTKDGLKKGHAAITINTDDYGEKKTKKSGLGGVKV